MVDSVAYGTGYTGIVNFGTKFNTNMPSSGTQAVRLTGPLCTQGFNCGSPPDNSTDYSILDVNMAGQQPRNNSGQTGPISPPDTDGDGVADPSDLCPGTAPAAPVDTVGCSQAQVDADLDGWCNIGAPGPGSPACTPTDNCPDWANPLQEAPAWTTPGGDTDCDGYHPTTAFGARAPESAIGTVSTQHCAATPATGDEGLPDAWPPDFNDNQLVNGADILSFNPKFGSTVGGGPPYDVRWDLNASGLINGADVLQLNPFFGKRCKPLP